MLHRRWLGLFLASGCFGVAVASCGGSGAVVVAPGSDGGGAESGTDAGTKPTGMDGGGSGDAAGTKDAGNTDGANAPDAGAIDAGPFGGNWPPDGGWGPDADLPYWPTNYDEPYRGQYFFTAPNGWLNDVNGVWYFGGVYHLSYQAYPFTLDGLAKHWGHATSPDMVHWTTAPVMLDPGVNVPGDAWSGSTVVDVDNTSGFQTGSNPVLVTLYTATSIGTAIAYSNDLGVTWQAYAENPVAIGGTDSSTRDPHVFWYATGNEWVCVHYDGGINIYTSPDLKTWTLQSNVAFGFECPDMYELPVDGVATSTKWVLQDASGSYLLGQFDGKSFTPDTGGPYAMDVGDAFYAAQTFYRRTFPDDRVVQMAWMRKVVEPWQTAPFNQSISFPAVLALKTFPEGIRITRTPIAEINSLYGATQHFGPQTLAAGANLFAGLASKTYDYELVLDVANSSAQTVTFKLANDSFTYDLKNAQLLGNALAPLNGQVTIRVLADWNELSVFGNGGELSYTGTFLFTPTDSSLSVTADGSLALVSADFRQLNRIWPGKAALSSVQLDDADPSTQYTGSWASPAVTGDATYLQETAHVGTDATSAVQATMNGTRLEWHGLLNVDLGKVDVSIDGAVVATNIDTYSPTRQIATLFTKSGLTNGPHTIRVAANGTKNAASSGIALVHDFFASYVDP